MKGLTLEQAKRLYATAMIENDRKALRDLCLEDLFFLLYVGCRRTDMNREWIYHRCEDVQRQPDGYLDLWAREHYKSTIITYGKTIQDILANPNITVGLFSHTRPIAKAFLQQIKREFEDNVFLKDLFPDVLYERPSKESPQWGLDGGIVVKRSGNPKEATVEAWGLVDGQPTSKHYQLLVYDDVVTRESVGSPEMILKTTDAWALSLNLGARGGATRTIGTRYHYGDTYRVMMDRGSVAARILPATVNGKFDGDPVLLERKELNDKRRDMGPYVFGCQMLQNPTAEASMGFKEEWLRQCVMAPQAGWNFYILVDPANEKKKRSDYTSILVIATSPDRNYRLVDGIRDRLNLSERTAAVFNFARKYKPVRVGYEKYGLQSDVAHIREKMDIENYHFEMVELGGQASKFDRIQRLVPTFEQGRFWMPYQMLRKDYQGMAYDLVNVFVKEELLAFPVSTHDDVMDCCCRIHDEEMGIVFPQEIDSRYTMLTVPTTTNSEYDVLAR